MSPLLLAAVDAAERGLWWPATWYGRFWILFGLGAQAMFTARFLIQWLASEREGKSYVPVPFWYLSLAGAVMLLAYAVMWKQDPVLTLGQSAGAFVYVRNLMLIKRERRLSRATPAKMEPPR